MFDWNDEELPNILWGEQGEIDDRTVPYPEDSKNYCSKKEWSQETTNFGTADQNIAEAKTDGKRLGCSSNFRKINDGASASGVGAGSLVCPSESSGVKTDQECSGLGVFNNLKRCDSPRDTRKLDKQPEIFHHLDVKKAQVDLMDYGWANIGSLDDLDRIFSCDDPLFGDASIGSSDELWYSSKDITSSPLNSLPISVNFPCMDLANTCESIDVKKELMQESKHRTILECRKRKDLASPDLQNALLGVDNIKSPGRSVLRASEQAHWEKKVPQDLKRVECRNSGNLLQELYSTSSPSGDSLRQFQNHLPPWVIQSCPGSSITPQQQFQGPDSFQGQYVALVTPSGYDNHSDEHIAMPVLSHIQQLKKPSLSGYVTPSMNANFSNKKHLAMTPQEKIVKLRRRQQMQAMLAIQKQQVQFSYPVCSTSHSIVEKSSLGSEIQQVDGIDAELDNLSAFGSLYPSSPIEHDDSGTIFVPVDNYALEDTILYRLQDIIAKLDIRIRLCIRDSLLRLAQSAMQRHNTVDASSTCRDSLDEQRSSAENKTDHSRYASKAETETATNPIDRTVAHLLFHSPLELSEKMLEPPESSASTKTSYECKMSENTSVMSSDSNKQKQKFYFEGSAIAYSAPAPASEQQQVDRLNNNPSIASSENASNYVPADGAVMEAS